MHFESRRNLKTKLQVLGPENGRFSYWFLLKTLKIGLIRSLKTLENSLDFWSIEGTSPVLYMYFRIQITGQLVNKLI